MNKIWKRSISLLLVLCTLVGYIVLPDVPAAQAEVQSQAVTATNLVENGTFEKESNGTVEADITGWSNISGIWSVVAEEGKENNYVAKVVDDSATGGRYIYYGFTVEPGCTYTLKVDYKGKYTASNPGIYVRKGAQNGTNLHMKGFSALSADTWQTYEAQVEIPADTTKAFILIASPTAGVGTACFDNISFTKVVAGDNEGGHEGGNEGGSTTPAADNLIANSTFGSTEADMSGWTRQSASGIWKVEADPDKAGNFVLQLTDDSTASGGYVYATVQPEVGTYKLKFDYKTDDAPQVIVRGNAATTAGIELLKKTCAKTNGEWATFEAEIKVTSDVSTVYILLNSGQAVMNSAYFDNVSFAKEQTVPVTGNQVPNGTFGSTEADFSGWNHQAGDGIWTVVADPDKAGNFLLQLADDSTTAGGYVYSTIQPEAGFYKLTIDYKTDSAPQVIVRANSASTSGEELLKETFSKTNGAWKTYEAIIEVAEAFSNINILLNTGLAVQNSAYFDNISFEKTEISGGDGEDSGEMVDPEDVIVIPEQNLLDNPFFELTLFTYTTPINATALPNGWTLETMGTGVQLFKTNASAYKGEWAIQAVDASASGSFKLSTKIENIQPGQEYKYIYARTGKGSPSIYVRCFDAEGKLLEEFTNAQAGFSNWRTSWRTFVAPENTSYAIVSLESTAAATCNIYLDDLQFFATSGANTRNMLTNASFEEYPEGFEDILISSKNESTLKGWTIGSGADKISLVPTETELDKSVVGNYMIKMDDQDSGTGMNMYYVMDVEPGKTYTYSAMVRGEYTESYPSIRIAYYYDEDCKEVANIGSKQHKTVTISCSPDFWTRGIVSTTAPEGAVKARVYLISSNASVGTAYFGNLAVVKGVSIKYDNLDFEDLDKTGAVESWDSYEDGKLAASTKDPFAGKISLQVKDNSQSVQQGAISKITDLSGYQISGYATDELTYYITARVKDTKNVKGQLAIIYYDNGFKELSRDSVTSAGTGKWQFLLLASKAPATASYAKLVLLVGDNAEATGTVYWDDMTIVEEYGQYVDEAYDYDIKYDEGNRLYFTEEELKKIREFAMDDTINAFGVSGANAYRSLIRGADTYVDQEYFYQGWDASPNNDRVTLYKVNLDHIQDISADPLLDDVPGGRNWPYLEGISGGLYNRFTTVAMAYAITGDTKYSDQAISWALDMCEWEYWTETKYNWWLSNEPVNASLDNPRITMGMATIYDMCYDQMTQEERDLIAQNIIYKGVAPMYADMTGPRRQTWHNKFLMRCSAVLLGTLAVINEDNKDELSKYLDRGYAFANAFLDARYTESENEGYSYTSLSLEELAMGMDSLLRVTGRTGLLEHPYFSEILVDWVVDFLSPGEIKQFPVYSDSHATGRYFKTTMLMLNRNNGDGKAGYYLQKMGLDTDYFKVLLYADYEPVITEPTENDYVAYVERVGYGGLRTGWDDGDLMLYIVGNNSASGHGQYDQLSFQLFTDDLWPAVDPGYSNLSDGFDEQQGHNLILVDGQWQTIKGQGTLESVVDAQLYGQFSGSAPGAYAEGLLTQWDRHTIMINHGDRPYYIIIDEMASNTERVYDFNLNTGGWKDITVDGNAMAEGVNKGNKVAVYGSNGYIFAEFVSKEKMNIEAVTYEDGGPVLQADSGKNKSQQYMTILTKPYGVEVDESYSFLQLLNTPDLVAYKTSSNDSTITKSVTASGNALYFFRGQSVGDWIELPFTLDESGTYDLMLKIAKSYNYGIYKIFIDDELITTYDGYDESVYTHELNLGKREVAAGEHMLRLELVGVNPKSIGALISVASLTFATEREMPDAPIYTQEVYDTDKVLGAKIFHTVNNYDIVLHNRGTGKITAGGVTTNGEQAAIIGVMEDGYMEGFTLITGTSLTFDGKTLVKASNAATVSADFRGKAKYAVTTEKDQSISLYAPYEIVGATVDGKSVKYSVDGNMAKVSVPAGTHTVVLYVKNAVEYLWGNEGGEGKTIYDANGEIIYKIWEGVDGTAYLYEDGQLKLDAYFDPLTKVLIREKLLEDGSWQITTHDLIGNISKIEIEHPNGNLTTVTYQLDGSISTLVTDKRGEYLEMTMDYPDGSKTVAQYLDDKTVTTKYGANGNVLAVTTMYNDGRRVEETYDENGKLLSKITRTKGGNREEVVYNADGSVVTTVYTANKLTSVQTVNADGTSILEEHLEDGSVRVTKYDKDGNVLEVTIDGKLVEEEKADNSWIIIVIVAVAIVGAAALMIVLVKIKKRNAK